MNFALKYQLVCRFRLIIQKEHLPNRLFEEAKGPICFIARKNDVFVSI